MALRSLPANTGTAARPTSGRVAWQDETAGRYRVDRGRALPAGLQDCCDGVNFALFSRHAWHVELLVYEAPGDPEPALRLDLSATGHRTGDVWHALVAGLRWGQAYAYRVEGPWEPERGHRFDGSRRLLDPYAQALAGADEAGRPDRCLLVDPRFDWQDVERPKTPWSQTVIYETHVRGLTVDPSASVGHPGSFLGVIEKIPYLKELGVTAVELMPVQEFDPAGPRAAPRADDELRNYWGYQPLAFLAPARRYASGEAPGCQLAEFKTMVRELHRAGIEVILDVVFNHTAEGGKDGPTFSFRGLDNTVYYLLDGNGRYLDFSGCGNTLNCNHPVVRDYLIDCLRYWATEMQVDGFRFDLASILGRDEGGELAPNAPLLERIAEDPILRDVKLIAEAWDSGGAYQVGCFPGQRWSEWNARFRDDVRRFWRGDPGTTGAFASRLSGSADLYQRSGKQPVNSVNFVTCHDGFTLNDLVSYATKHNEANGEANRDGADENFSANYGVEGPSDDPAVEAVRVRQIKNLLATLLLARGVPMLLGGDEFRRTQRGNNNAYCQDNELSWYDWRLLERHAEILRFAKSLIALRKAHPMLAADAFLEEGDVEWLGPWGRPPEWDGPIPAVGCLLHPQWPSTGRWAPALCLLFNASPERLPFRLPASRHGTTWQLLVDTARPAPHDLPAGVEAPSLQAEQEHCMEPRSLIVLCEPPPSAAPGSVGG